MILWNKCRIRFFFGFATSQSYFDELTIKHIILNLADCLELLVKYRL